MHVAVWYKRELHIDLVSETSMWFLTGARSSPDCTAALWWQVVDTGLDELSCFFVDRTGEIEHSTIQDPVSDLKRRKVGEDRTST